MKSLSEIRQQIGKLKPSDSSDYEKLLGALADNSTIGIYIVQDGKFKFTNSMFQNYVGYSENELSSIDSLSIVYPEDRDIVKRNAVKMLKGNGSAPYEFRYVNKNGESLWVIESVTSIEYQGRQAALGSFIDTTQRKQLEERYRYLLDDTYNGYGITQEGKIVFANRRFAEIFGYDPEEVIGEPIDHFLMPDDRQALMDQYKRVMRKKAETPLLREISATKKDGTAITVEANIKVIQYEKKPAAFLIVRDISKPKHVEEKYRHILENMNDGFSVIEDGKIVFANRRFCEIFGYDTEQVMGKSLEQFIIPEDRQAAILLYEQVMKGLQKAPERHERCILRKDGTPVVIEASSKSADYEGRPAFYTIVRDITDSKQAEASLRQSEEKLRLIFESVPEGIVITDFDGNIVDINNSALLMHGYNTKEDLIGQKGTILISPRYHTSSASNIKKTLTLKGEIQGVIHSTFIKKDGSEFPVMLSTAVMKDDSNQPAGVVSVIADITEQQKRQQQLMLTDRLASIGQLVAGVTHELNNPLTGVIGISELLLGKEMPDDIREDVEIVNKEAKRAASVVKGLLTFVRNKGTEKSLIDINCTIQEVLQLRSYEQKVSNIEMETKYDENLPRIIASGTQMQQVFMNLIINAEQSILEARGKGKITIATEKNGNMVRISIHDDGPGIRPENIKRLFTPFFTTKAIGKGTGLGLSICHGIITEHGGRIYAVSKPNKGATFFMELPVPA